MFSVFFLNSAVASADAPFKSKYRDFFSLAKLRLLSTKTKRIQIANLLLKIWEIFWWFGKFVLSTAMNYLEILGRNISSRMAAQLLLEAARCLLTPCKPAARVAKLCKSKRG